MSKEWASWIHGGTQPLDLLALSRGLSWLKGGKRSVPLPPPDQKFEMTTLDNGLIFLSFIFLRLFAVVGPELRKLVDLFAKIPTK